MQPLLRLRRSGFVALVAGLSCLIAGRSAWGVERIYTIVTGASSITASGDIGGSAISQQGPGGLTTTYSGTIRTDRQVQVVNSVEFIGGSVADANTNGSWLPVAGGGSGSATPADYGGRISVLGTVNIAARNLVADLTSDDVLPVTGGNFDLSTLFVLFTDGNIAYRHTIFGTSGSESLVDAGGLLSGSQPGTIITQSVGPNTLRETLTIPINATFVVPTDLGDANITLFGSVQATSDFADPHERFWITPGTETFATAANWNPAITPVAADTAVFDLGSASNHTVNFGANATNSALRIENDKVALALATRTYALTSTSAATPSVIVGATAGDNGSLTLSGTGAGGALNSVNASLGDGASSTGAVTVGAGATWNNSVDLYIGKSGTGTLTINGGGKVVAPTGGGSYIGYAAGSSGSSVSVSGSGSTWTNDYLFVGHAAAGTLTTASSGVVTSKVASVGYNATGGVTVNNSTFTNTDVLFVGEHATGTMNVQSGGVLNGLTTNIGANTGANGTVTVAGTGAQWNNTGSVYVGGIFSASGGTGLLNVNSSGTATIGGTLKTYANGTVNLSSGKLKAATMNIALGAFNHTGGQLVATTVTGNLGRAGGTLTPGDSSLAGLTTVTGNYTQQVGATLAIELGGLTSGTQYDRLAVTGTATLAGTLQVSLINAFMPTFGNTFQILTATAGRSGTFGTQTLPTLANSNLEWLVNYGPTSGATSLTISVGLKGDFNGNGVVDAADYVVWRKTSGTPAQYTLWRSRFGTTASGSGSGSGSSSSVSSAAVPEPGALALLAMACVPVFGRGLRRRQQA